MNERKPKPLTVRQQNLLLDQLQGPMQEAFQKIEQAERIKAYEAVRSKLLAPKFVRRYGSRTMIAIQGAFFTGKNTKANVNSFRYGFSIDAFAMAIYIHGSGNGDYNAAVKKARKLEEELTALCNEGKSKVSLYQRMNDYREKLKLKLAFVGSNMDVDAFLASARKELDAMVKAAGSE